MDRPLLADGDAEANAQNHGRKEGVKGRFGEVVRGFKDRCTAQTEKSLSNRRDVFYKTSMQLGTVAGIPQHPPASPNSTLCNAPSNVRTPATLNFDIGPVPLLKKRFIVKTFLNLASQRGASLIEYSLVCSLLILLAIPSVRKIAGFDQTLDKSLVNGNVEIIQGEMGSGLKGRFGDVVRGFENAACQNGQPGCNDDPDIF